MRLVRLIAACAALTVVSPAFAVTQPDGTVVPQLNHVQALFDARTDPIRAQADAAIVPETFHPGCRLTFTVVSRGGALFQDAFGWYNATGSAPDPADLHVLIPCGAAPGFVATLDVTHEPAYRGGEIGVFLRTPQTPGGSGCAGGDCCASATHPGYTYFSERRFNPDSSGASTSYIHLLVYDSRATPRAFYFAWEDLYSGGDNEFTDFVALVGNIVCTGAGGACDTGMPGVCAQGTDQCRSGALACVPVNTSRAEACDGLDNDCDGTVDNGTSLCPAGQVCERGACVDHCVEGSCFEGFTCSSQGTCVETACTAVTCPSGQRCEAGHCVAPCDAVVCPSNQVCRVGRCVDPCAGVTCDAEEACTDGVCQTRCECRGCAAGQSCGSDGRCAATDCATVMCPAGEVCAGGACHDACAGAMCPRGEVCRTGECVMAPPSPVDPAADAGPLPIDAAQPDAGGVTDAGFDAADVGVDAPSFPAPRPSCHCRVRSIGARSVRTHGQAFGLFAIAALTGAFARRRKPRE